MVDRKLETFIYRFFSHCKHIDNEEQTHFHENVITLISTIGKRKLKISLNGLQKSLCTKRNNYTKCNHKHASSVFCKMLR